MPKRWVRGGTNPEGTRYLIEVSVPKLRKTKDGVPEKPPTFPGTNITSAQLEESEKRGGPSTQAAHISEALESKEE